MAFPIGKHAHFVTTDWLADNLTSPGLVVIDSSWYLPDEKRDPYAEYLTAHIPGAVFFDIDAIADHSTPLPHMLPDPVTFSSAMRKLGIGDGMRALVYDGAGLFSAPRVWWTLRAFGMRDIAVLEGGLPKWKAEGRPLEEGRVQRQPRHFTARLDHGAVASLADVQRIVEQRGQLVDARSAPRFAGEEPEPRPGLRPGHIPGSMNLPWREIIADGHLLPPPALAEKFAAAGVDTRRPLTTTCGSGLSAAILALALESLGQTSVAVYDGSWTEWGGRRDLPAETGKARAPA
ncbi:MAG: thiosulfate/3-mercaptopyruvate sulfurtransferase [Methylobacteriaceae bacterium]|jgi:thiosulfate/3-mercaptopyruvate sulfurtransferase|nr:thiosulfate/3-mercaptopyruvate sulfurtransferase [Methylobacteriaceae bacterium]